MNSNLTYQSLYNTLLNWIKSNCNNIDSFSSSVSAAMKSNWSSTVRASSGTGGINISIDNSTAVSIVSSATVDTQLSDYMTSVGIVTKLSSIVTTNGLISFWNAAATFCAGKLRFASGQFATTPLLMYFSGNDLPSSTVPNIESELINANSVSTMLKSLNTALVTQIKAHKIHYNISAYSSCSCSSSCSSSS